MDLIEILLYSNKIIIYNCDMKIPNFFNYCTLNLSLIISLKKSENYFNWYQQFFLNLISLL